MLFWAPLTVARASVGLSTFGAGGSPPSFFRTMTETVLPASTVPASGCGSKGAAVGPGTVGLAAASGCGDGDGSSWAVAVPACPSTPVRTVTAATSAPATARRGEIMVSPPVGRASSAEHPDEPKGRSGVERVLAPDGEQHDGVAVEHGQLSPGLRAWRAVGGERVHVGGGQRGHQGTDRGTAGPPE